MYRPLPTKPSSQTVKVEIVHPLQTFTVSYGTLVQKSTLFADDPTLGASPYLLKSQVSLIDLKTFLLALDGTSIKINNSNIRGLSQLCDEFGFISLAAELLEFRNCEDFKEELTTKDTPILTSLSMTEMRHSGSLFEEHFIFRSKDVTIESSVGQAVALSPAVREQLSVDACARTFGLETVKDVNLLQDVLSHGSVLIDGSKTGLGSQLCNPGLEIEIGLAGSDFLDFDSVDLSMFSIEALDDVLSNGLFSIVDECDLLERLLNLGEDYHPLLRWIDFRFLDSDGIARLAEHLIFAIEWMWSEIVEGLIVLSLELIIVDFDEIQQMDPFEAEYCTPVAIRMPDRSVPYLTARFDSDLSPLHHLPRPLGWCSLIVPHFPDIFEEFRTKHFSRLWRGSRDGFSAGDFHVRCDGHANTLTVILDTDGNIFDGFTPVEWESLQKLPFAKPDPSLTSFLFTLQNPHHFPARRFGLRVKQRLYAIGCDPLYGPDFCDINICQHCNQNPYSCTVAFGDVYTNDTGLNGETFFTGSSRFTVKEMEVIEITD
jgi:hypothetical protein